MKFDFSIIATYWTDIWRGLLLTIEISAICLIPSLVIGLMAALGHLSNKRAPRIVSTSYVELFRNTPILIQAFIAYYVLPFYGIRLGSLRAGILTLTLYTGSYFAEIIRGGILAVPRGQVDAARSVGMSYSLALRRIVLPQMAGYLIPPLTNEMMAMIKHSSVLSFLTVPELTLAGTRILAYTFRPIEAYTIITVLYWMLNAAVARAMLGAEKRMNKYRRGTLKIPTATLRE